MGKLSHAVDYRCYIESTGLKSSEFVGHIVGGMGRVPFAPGKRRCRVLDAPGTVLSKDKNPPWDIQNMYGSSFWARRFVGIVGLAYAPFTLTPGSRNGFQCCQV